MTKTGSFKAGATIHQVVTTQQQSKHYPQHNTTNNRQETITITAHSHTKPQTDTVLTRARSLSDNKRKSNYLSTQYLKNNPKKTKHNIIKSKTNKKESKTRNQKTFLLKKIILLMKIFQKTFFSFLCFAWHLTKPRSNSPGLAVSQGTLADHLPLAQEQRQCQTSERTLIRTQSP